jgi:hypothetical protein
LKDYVRTAENVRKLQEQTGKIKDVDRFLNKMTEFLIGVNKISADNCRSVMKRVKQLVLGQGITYESKAYGWEHGQYVGKTYVYNNSELDQFNGIEYPDRWFMKGVKCDLLTDYVELLQHAAWCENTWGVDHGNGWLLNHPLKVRCDCVVISSLLQPLVLDLTSSAENPILPILGTPSASRYPISSTKHLK